MTGHAAARAVARPVGRAPAQVKGVGYLPESVALFARMTTEPDATRKGHINTLIKALKDAGVWSKLDCVYVLAAHDAQAARRNWKSDAFNPAVVGSPAFTADRGYAGDASGAYLTTGYQLGISGQSTQDNNYMMVWSRTESQASVTELGNTNNSLGLRSTTDNFSARSMTSSALTDTLASSLGMFGAARDGGSSWRKSRNGVLVASKTTASTAPAAAEIYLLGRNNAGSLATPSGRQLAAAAMGAYLTEAEELAMYTPINTFLTAVGAV